VELIPHPPGGGASAKSEKKLIHNFPVLQKDDQRSKKAKIKNSKNYTIKKNS
jgi:hypothetical protein